jgi:hypothetical protein
MCLGTLHQLNNCLARGQPREKIDRFDPSVSAYHYSAQLLFFRHRTCVGNPSNGRQIGPLTAGNSSLTGTAGQSLCLTSSPGSQVARAWVTFFIWGVTVATSLFIGSTPSYRFGSGHGRLIRSLRPVKSISKPKSSRHAYQPRDHKRWRAWTSQTSSTCTCDQAGIFRFAG